MSVSSFHSEAYTLIRFGLSLRLFSKATERISRDPMSVSRSCHRNILNYHLDYAGTHENPSSLYVSLFKQVCQGAETLENVKRIGASHYCGSKGVFSPFVISIRVINSTIFQVFPLFPFIRPPECS